MRDNTAFLEIIRDCCRKIQECAVRGEKAFFADELLQDAVLRNFQVIGDAVKDLSPEFRQTNSEIGWSDYTKFRDKLTHAYFGVDLNRVWDFMQSELLVLKN